MTRQGQGFTDKLYWRLVGRTGQWHCFKRAEGGGYWSLCDKFAKLSSGGQECRRPIPAVRCGVCDGKEMGRRGWDESGPTLHPEKERS